MLVLTMEFSRDESSRSRRSGTRAGGAVGRCSRRRNDRSLKTEQRTELTSVIPERYETYDRESEKMTAKPVINWELVSLTRPLLLRKEVIQPHLPVRLPCYDFTPITDPTFDGSLPKGLGHRLRVLPTFVV